MLIKRCTCSLRRSAGLVSRIKERCQPEIEQYERCLLANPDTPSTCVGQLRKLQLCTEAAGLVQQSHACGPDCGLGDRARAAAGRPSAETRESRRRRARRLAAARRRRFEAVTID